MDGFWSRMFSLFKKQGAVRAKPGCPHCALPSGHPDGPRALDYPKEKTIRRVFINEGCMICDACVVTCPEVFKLDASTSVSLRSAEFTTDAERHFGTHREKIEEAALGCCVSVIGIEYMDGSFSPMGGHPWKLEHVAPDRRDLPVLEISPD